MKLNIQLFASDIINGSSTASNCDCRIKWSSSIIDGENKSSVTATVQIKRSGSGSTTGTFSGTLKINGTNYSVSKKFSPYNYGSWATVGSKTVTIEHEPDGTKTISISCNLTQTGTTMAGTYTASGSATLDEIARASEIDSITNGTTPYNPTIVWTPKNSSFRYQVEFLNSINQRANISNTIVPNQTTPYTYDSLAVYNNSYNNVDSITQTMTAILYTYKSDDIVNPIGTKTQTFTTTLNSNIKPTISISNLAEADETMQSLNWGIYVKGKSKLSYKINYSFPFPMPSSATLSSNTNGQNFNANASISEYTQTQTFTTNILSTVGTNTITARATDSRTRYTDATPQTYTVINYSNPTISTAQVQRCDANGNITNEGEYCYISYGASISSCENNNKANTTYKVGYRVHNTGDYNYIPLTTNVNSYSASGVLYTDGIYPANRGTGTKLQLSTSNTYDIQFFVEDSFTETTNVQLLDTGFDLMNFNVNGKAMAIGKVSEAGANEELLEVALPTELQNYTKVKSYYTGRGCIVGTNASSTSTPYYKFASIKQYGSNSDKNITFKVFTGYGDETTKVGILTAHFRTNGSKEWNSGELKWEYCNSGVANGDYILAYKNVAVNGNDAKHVEVELYAKITSSWNLYHFEVICEGQRETRNSDWTLYSTTTGVNSIDSSFTTINSSYGIIKNRNYYSNTLEAYDDRISSPNITHYYDNAKAHMKLLLVSSAMTTNRPAGDGYILAYNWDNSGNYAGQLYIPNTSANVSLQYRGNPNSSWGSWEDIYRCKSLYDNSSGTNASITNLSETTANFKYIEIIYKTNDDYQKSVKVYSPNGKKVVLDASIISGNYTYVKSAQYSISGTSITLESGLSGQARIGNNVATTWDKDSNRIYIIKVLGYR